MISSCCPYLEGLHQQLSDCRNSAVEMATDLHCKTTEGVLPPHGVCVQASAAKE